jgi:hypothetical protein
MLYLALAFVGKMVYIYCINICIIGTPHMSTSMLSCYQPLISLSPVSSTRSHWMFSGSCLNDLMYELYLSNLLPESFTIHTLVRDQAVLAYMTFDTSST